MDIAFANSRLQRLCNSERNLRGRYGPRMAAIIQQRLVDLADAETLEDTRAIVGADCHELSGNFAGLLAVRLVYPDRMVFKPADDPIPRKPDGGLDWSGVTGIVIVGIGDYH